LVARLFATAVIMVRIRIPPKKIQNGRHKQRTLARQKKFRSINKLMYRTYPARIISNKI
jgi:hypothetical protein